MCARRCCGNGYVVILLLKRTGRMNQQLDALLTQRLCEAFSKRTAEIDAWLEATGTPNDPQGRQAAVLATRRGKPEVEGELFDAAWKAAAVEAGWGPAQKRRTRASLNTS